MTHPPSAPAYLKERAMTETCIVICCFHNHDEMCAAISVLAGHGFHASELDEIDDANLDAIWVAIDVITDFDIDRIADTVGAFHGAVAEFDCAEEGLR